MADALSVTAEELADHAERAWTGDQPPSAVADVDRARQLVVNAQVNTLMTSAQSERRKRSANGNLSTLTAITAIDTNVYKTIGRCESKTRRHCTSVRNLTRQ